MKILFILAMLCIAQGVYASETIFLASSGNKHAAFSLDIASKSKDVSCTVTRSQKHIFTGTDCDDQPVHIITYGTATATAATCEEANATAYLNAGYNAFMEAQAAFLLITWDCQGPPEP
jgi:hypothetical protein